MKNCSNYAKMGIRTASIGSISLIPNRLVKGRLARPPPYRRSESMTRGRQRRGVDAFAQRVVHRQVALGVKRHLPDGVVVVGRPSGHGWAGVGLEIGRDQRI